MATTFTPALGFSALTPFYDRVIRSMTRESVWRTRLVGHIAAKPGETILDIGSGTGTLAIAIDEGQPACSVMGMDPDPAVVELAKAKAKRSGSKAKFAVGEFGKDLRPSQHPADKITCSLVLHQVSLVEKRRLFRAMFDGLKPGGQLFIADYGHQTSLSMRLGYRLTVQMLDGKTNTQPNADGVLPQLIAEAGFQKIRSLDCFTTVTGSIEIIRAEKSADAAGRQLA